jgi:hypothetical protein
MAVLLAALPLSLVAMKAAQAQDAYCRLDFTTASQDYDSKVLRVLWHAEGPAKEVALQIYQNGTVVDPDTNQDWRYYQLDDGAQAVLNVSNLRPGAFLLRAMMLDASQAPCKTNDGNLYVANTEIKWEPPPLQFELIPAVPDYASNSVSAQVHIDSAKQDVMYHAQLMVDGQLVGATDGIGKSNPFVVEISIPRNIFDFGSLKEAKEAELTVSVGYNAAEMVLVTQKPKFGPAPDVGLVERIGNIVLAVLNNPPIVMAILLVFGFIIVLQSSARPKKKSKPTSAPVGDRLPQNSVGKVSTVEFHTAPAVRARVVQKGDRTQEIVTNIEEFPFIFGRNKFLEHGQVVEQEGSKFLNLRNDPEISRNHFQLVRNGQSIGINVLSANAATVNEHPLGQSETVHLSGTEPTVVQIGEQTKIELTPIYLT